MNRVSRLFRFLALLTAAPLCLLPSAHATDAGVLDTGFVPKLFSDGEVQVTAKAAGGQLYVGGDFDWVSGQPADWLARVNADGSVDPAFSPTQPVNAGRLLALGVQADGKLLVGYFFQMIFYAMADATGSPAAGRAAKATISSGTPVAPITTTAGMIIRLNTDGSVDTAFNTVELGATWDTYDTQVLRFIQPMASGKILIGGSFLSVNGTTLKHLAQLNADGTVDTTFKTTVNGDVTDALRIGNGTTLIGGSFTQINGAKLPFGLARLNANGSRDAKFVAKGKPRAATVAKIAPGMGGNILIATASQQTVKGVVSSKSNLESVSSTGVYQAALAANVTGQVVDVALLGSGQAVLVSATGSETQTIASASTPAPGLAVFCNLAKAAAPQTVALPFHPNGLINVAAGLAGFGSSGVAVGSTPSGFAAVHRAGDKTPADFKGWVGKTATVSHVAASDSGLLVSGGFDFGVTSDGTIVKRQGLAKLNSDGSVDAVFAPPSTNVNLLLANADGGATIIGTMSSGLPGPLSVALLPYNTQSLFRLTPSGVLDSTFKVSKQSSASVLVAQADGKLVVGGMGGLTPTPVILPVSTSLVNASSSSSSQLVMPMVPEAPLRRYLSTGALDTSFTPDIVNTVPSTPGLPVVVVNDASTSVTQVDASITDVTLDTDGSLLVTGSFTQINGVDRPGIARLLADGTLDPDSLFTAVPSGFTHVLPRAGGYLVTAPSLWEQFLPVVMPGTVVGPVANAIVIGPIFGPGQGSTISPFLGTLDSGAADGGFSIADLVPSASWSFGGPRYGVTLIAPDPAGAWVAMTRGLKDTTTGNLASLVRISADGSLDRSFTAPVFGSNPSPFGNMPIFWWGPSQPADYVSSMVVLADGSVIVGGSFWSVNGEARSGLAKLNVGK